MQHDLMDASAHTCDLLLLLTSGAIFFFRAHKDRERNRPATRGSVLAVPETCPTDAGLQLSLAVVGANRIHARNGGDAVVGSHSNGLLS